MKRGAMFAATLCSCLGGVNTLCAQTSSPAASTVPFVILSTGGSPRTVVMATFNGHPIQMMVHSNAGFFAQLRHGEAESFGVKLRGAHENYGIDRPGHVSTLGMDEGVVASLAVGQSVDVNAPVSVFEIPQDNLGMLGVLWIKANRIMLDYRQSLAHIDPTQEQVESLGSELRRQGYVALPMTFDNRRNRYTVNAKIHGIARTMTIASATTLMIDSAFADAAGVKRGPEEDDGDGPTGTHVPNYDLAEPVQITIGEWTSPAFKNGTVMDSYKYGATPRPTQPEQAEGGTLGGDFLLKTKAVIDFGSLVLYVPR